MLRKKSSNNAAKPGAAKPVASPPSNVTRSSSMSGSTMNSSSGSLEPLSAAPSDEELLDHPFSSMSVAPPASSTAPPSSSLPSSSSSSSSSLSALPPPLQSVPTEATREEVSPSTSVTGEAATVSTSSNATATATRGTPAASGSSAPSGSGHAFAPIDSPNKSTRIQRMERLLGASSMDIDNLRQVCWSGIPSNLRPTVWRILSGFSKMESLNRKRTEYATQLVPSYYHDESTKRSPDEETMWHQISIDIPRTCPGEPFFQNKRVAQAMQRILYIWALKHPATSYVQGINDLMTPFLSVFGKETAETPCDIVDEQTWMQVEADTYWCFTKFADPLAEHYTFAQPGIQKMVFKLEELIKRLDAKLHHHIVVECQVQFLQFGFRWCNCLLMREWPHALSVRLFDTYLCEGPHFVSLHVYVCAALLMKFASQCMELDFTELVMFLQNLPTKNWTLSEVDLLLSQAFVWKTAFENSPSHYMG